ncbi:hypothetical protein DID88_005650 [Monilinia fructigena]|uniref:Magnesium transporter n=1 Tax=Monilinia fructigena TaxID=38457 RepID=A0A395J5P1_9HELO|nr:hypothetical protein DID88_005650 [Monilinia fructigena]
MAGTPIKIPGKNTRDSSKSAVLARKIQKRPRGRPLKLKSSKLMSHISQSLSLAPRESKVRTMKNIKSKRKMSQLEKLPTELLETIFLYCLNLSLPACSPVIGGKLSSETVYSKTIIAAFDPIWDEWYGKIINPDLERDYTGMDSSLQSAILRYRWARLPTYVNLPRDTEIPHKLLMGPWNEEAVRFLFWLVMGGVRIDWLTSTSGEAAIIGYKNAVRELRSSRLRIARRQVAEYLRAQENGHSSFGLRRGAKKPLQPDDLPSLSEDGRDIDVFSLGRSVSVKAASEPRLRCTELDENGNVVLVNGEFKKSELIAKYGLLPRDLRKIDSSTLPHILVRPSAILINSSPPSGPYKIQQSFDFRCLWLYRFIYTILFMYDLEGKLRQKQTSPSAGGLPYEFRALEAVLISVTSGLEKEFETVREPVVRVLKELEEDIDRDKLRYLLIYSKKLGTFEQKAKLRGEDDHTEVEMLLESYHKLCDEIVQESGNLVSNIRNTEEIVKAIS